MWSTPKVVSTHTKRLGTEICRCAEQGPNRSDEDTQCVWFNGGNMRPGIHCTHGRLRRRNRLLGTTCYKYDIVLAPKQSFLRPQVEEWRAAAVPKHFPAAASKYYRQADESSSYGASANNQSVCCAKGEWKARAKTRLRRRGKCRRKSGTESGARFTATTIPTDKAIFIASFLVSSCPSPSPPASSSIQRKKTCRVCSCDPIPPPGNISGHELQ